MTTILATIKLRGDTAANWTSVNPVLAAKELGLETDTGLVKIGDGGVGWNGLPYALGGVPVYALGQLTPAADKLPYFTGIGSAALTDLTLAARLFLAAVDQEGQRDAIDLGESNAVRFATVRCDDLRIDQAPTAETITPTHTLTINLNGATYKIPAVAA